MDFVTYRSFLVPTISGNHERKMDLFVSFKTPLNFSLFHSLNTKFWRIIKSQCVCVVHLNSSNQITNFGDALYEVMQYSTQTRMYQSSTPNKTNMRTQEIVKRNRK